MANAPNYNLNHPNDYPRFSWRNRAITDAYEPGSTFKFVTCAAALQDGIMKPNNVIYAERGSIMVGGAEIRDSHEYGWLTFAQVFEKSSNPGVIKIAEALGEKRLYEYARSFGFGSETGIELPGEIRGTLRNPRKWSLRSLATIAIGHEISVTSLQLLNAFSVSANDGNLMRPYIIKAITDVNNNIIETQEPKRIRKVTSPNVSLTMQEIFKGVVENGTGTAAQIEGYEIAGKTGTAQKKVDGEGYGIGKYIASFVGYLPAEDPTLAAIVLINEPTGGAYWGGKVAAPLFRIMMERIIQSSTPYLPRRGNIIAQSEWNTNTNIDISNLITIPDLKGKTEKEARRIIRELGFEIELVGNGNEVIDHFPLAGKEVAQGSTIRLSFGEELEPITKAIILPDVIGMSMRKVSYTLLSENINVKFIGSGLAVNQTPIAGTEIKQGDVCVVEFEPPGI